MEDNLPEIETHGLRKPYVVSLLHTLKTSMDEAKELRDEVVAQNPEIRRALTIVEFFLRKKQRLCYGGMAINAHLPAKLKFYDFKKTIPDYDFFSPTPEKDTEELMGILEKGKFENVARRFGVHDGTYKIYVNYNAVADITHMSAWMYNKLYTTSIKLDDIRYVDANYLRMAMYLELSRPYGEVERWDKVYKRLLLLNLVKPVIYSVCKKEKQPIVILNKESHKELVKYIIDNKFIFCGAEISEIYKSLKSSAGFIFKTNYPLIFYAKEPLFHISKIRLLIHAVEPKSKIRVVHWAKLKDIVPEMYGIKINNKLSILILDQNYCYGYNTITVPGYGKMHIASLDTAITLYFTLSYLRDLDSLVPNSVECFAYDLVEISRATRDKGKTGQFPPFVTTCEGHQPSKGTLLKIRAERINAYKNTRKNKQTIRRTVKKR